MKKILMILVFFMIITFAYTQEKISTVLIGTDKSEYKSELVKELKSKLKEKGVKVKVTKVKSVYKSKLAKYSKVLVIESGKYNEVSKKTRKFIEDSKFKGKIILYLTVKKDLFDPKIDVDTVMSPSQLENINLKVKEIMSKIYKEDKKEMLKENILITYSKTEFKDALVKKLSEKLKENNKQHKIIDLKEAYTENFDIYSKVIILDAGKYSKVNDELRKLIEGTNKKKNIVLFLTYKKPGWDPKIDVDVLMGPSEMNNIDKNISEIMEKLKK